MLAYLHCNTACFKSPYYKRSLFPLIANSMPQTTVNNDNNDTYYEPPPFLPSWEPDTEGAACALDRL